MCNPRNFCFYSFSGSVSFNFETRIMSTSMSTSRSHYTDMSLWKRHADHSTSRYWFTPIADAIMKWYKIMNNEIVTYTVMKNYVMGNWELIFISLMKWLVNFSLNWCFPQGRVCQNNIVNFVMHFPVNQFSRCAWLLEQHDSLHNIFLGILA